MSLRDTYAAGQGAPKVEHLFSVKVDNIAFGTTKESVREVFEKYGEIGDVFIPRDPYSGDSKGFAFVRFVEEKDAQDAIDGANGQEVDGRELRCEMARRQRPSNPRQHYAERDRGRRDDRGYGGGYRDRRDDYRRDDYRRDRDRDSRERDRRRDRSRSRSRDRRGRERERSRSRDRRRSRSRD